MSDHSPNQLAWKKLGRPAPDSLADARLQLHWAAQVIAAVGYTHIEKAGDDSQSNMGWVDGMQVLVGRLLDGESGCFVSLTPTSLTLSLRDPGGDAIDEFVCHGHTLDECYDWLQQAIATHRNQDPVRLKRPTYDLPAHAVAQGRPFAFEDAEAFAEVARWFHDANIVMRDLRKHNTNATLPRVWPHHFDMGMLLSLEESGDPQTGRSIGIGLSPGDASDPSPYWYVNPYPAPEGAALPDLPHGGEWNTKGWLGAKLDAEAQVAGDASTQEMRARAFVAAAVRGCRELLSEGPDAKP